VTSEYRGALDTAIREYEALGAERQRIDKRLAELAQTISTLSRLLGLTPTVPLGLTDAVRLVMRAGVPMSPVEVRDRLHGIGFDVSKYANDLAAVHTILKRLNSSGELRLIPRPNGVHYTWNRPTTVVALGPDILRYMREQEFERDALRASAEGADVEPPESGAARPRRKGTRR
jgi:hypothetical protein